jgi:hypothetical protein
LVGADATCFDFVMNELDSRGIRFQHSVEELSE